MNIPMDWTKFVSIAVLVCVTFQYGEGCSCFPQHKQQHFCQADFAMRFVIKKSKPGTSNSVLTTQEPIHPGSFEIQHNIYKVKVYKSSPKFDEVVSKNFLYTASSGSMCGINLKERTKYFITGRVSNGKLRVGLCDWYDEWRNIPKRQRRLIKTGYNQRCDTCKIETCFGQGSCKKSTQKKDHCDWNFSSPFSDCYDRFALCKCKSAPKATTRCRWSYGRYLSGFVTCYQEAKGMSKAESP